MRAEVVAVVPFWSQSEALNWDSNWSFIRRTLPALSRERPDTVWVVLWPQRSVGSATWRWRDDGLFDHPRIARFPWPYATDMRHGVTGFDPAMFAQLEDRWAPTVYWLNMVEAGVHMSGGYRQSNNVLARPVMVAQHHYVIHRTLPTTIESNMPRLWLQMGGTVIADRVVLNSQYALRMLSETFGEYLSTKTLAGIAHKTQVVPFGLVDDGFTSLPDAEYTGQPPTIVYNHRFEGYKNPKTTADVLNGLRAGGHVFRVWITQYLAQMVAEFPYDAVVGSPDYREYLRRINVPAINTTNSQHETFCISVLDSLALGHVVVLPNALTFPELVPEGYPYLFDTPQQQGAMLAHVIDTWPTEWQAWSARLRTHARTTFDVDTYARRYASILHDQDALYATNQKETTIRARERLLGGLRSGVFDLDTVARRYRRETGLGDQAAPNRRVVRDLVMAGATPEVMPGQGGDRLGIRWTRGT